MPRHIFYIDPLQNLNTKKDSSLFLATTLQNEGFEVLLLFKSDLFWTSRPKKYRLHTFKGVIGHDFYLTSFELGNEKLVELQSGDTIHMRLDPPFDHYYLRSLWLLDCLTKEGVNVINHPRGIMIYHEKLSAYMRPESIASFVGEHFDDFIRFIDSLPAQFDEIVLKPLDLFSGIGVKKVSRTDKNLHDIFHQMTKSYGGVIIAQPFMKNVYHGEVRAVVYRGQILGAILKKPKDGEFISNIAQGASFKSCALSKNQEDQIYKMSHELSQNGIDWIAYDILDNVITEANVTCPGLLVELSHALNANLALRIKENL